MLTRIMLTAGLLSVAAVVTAAQTPVLSSVEAPYPALQSPVQLMGINYGAGAVNYGPAGAPLQLIGSHFGSSGVVEFDNYRYACALPSGDCTIAGGTAVQATVTAWTDTTLFLTVPPGAISGVIQVVANGATSNALPFMVVPGTYSSSCPTNHPSSQLEITTDSLPNGTVNSAYSTTLQTSGNSGTLTWSLSSGTLPAGLSLDASSGVISGTPTSATSSPVSLSVSVTDSGSGQTADATLDISIDSQTPTSAIVYSYSASYDAVGNVTQYVDSVMGTWNFTYDTLNRLETAVPGANAPSGYAEQNLCFAYDAFGNRTAQSLQTAACPAQESSVTPTATYNANNQVTSSSVNLAVNGFQYDGAGYVTYDGANYYAYDAEGRVCAVQPYPSTNGAMAFGYLYDAEGNRVAKGWVTPSSNPLSQALSCDPSVNGFQLTQTYVLNQGGQESSMLSTQNGVTTWERSNVYGAGRLLATYDTNGLHFHLTDPLGTRRVQTDSNGVAEAACQSLPYGDQFNCFPVNNAPPTADDSTPLHFTAKERDSESGNDYFGARYYSSNMGRWLSPDPAGMMAADIRYPQSLNRYAYVWNNPLSFTDPTGLDCAYLNNSGSGLESFDQNSSSGECGRTGGYWVDGGLTNININADQGQVSLTGTTNGTDQTNASYQDTTVDVNSYWNNWSTVPHTAFGISGQTPMGLNPASKFQFMDHKLSGLYFNAKNMSGGVPGVVKPQVGGQLLKSVHIPVTRMQAQMIQNEINQGVLNPPNYDIYGSCGTLDCTSWAQKVLGDAGINTGAPAQNPLVFENNLSNLYPQQ